MPVRAVLLAVAALAAAGSAAAQTCDTQSGHPVPRFLSLKSDEVNGRAGPSTDHPVKWVYVRAGLPVAVVAETVDWRQVRDPGGQQAWIHRNLLSNRRTVIASEEAVLRAREEADAPVEAVAEAGAVLRLERCRAGWCRVEAQGHRGWTPADVLWGLHDDERGALEGDEGACYRSAVRDAGVADAGPSR